MAIPGIPQNMIVQSANQQILISWDLSPGATSYSIERSLDNVTFSPLVTISGSPLATSYLDTTIALSTQYYYRVVATTVDGSSPFTPTQSGIATVSGEMSLSQIRLAAQQRADRVNSQFVTKAEWNQYINQAMFELYDLLITVYEDYFVAQPIQFNTNGSSINYPLPNGQLTFENGLDVTQSFVAPPFYKLMRVDLAVQNANNGYVTMKKFNFVDGNDYVFPNSASTIYGVFNCRYRVLGNNIQFIPTPSANQGIRLWYMPRLTMLLQDTDTTAMGISGWIEYVIVRAAKYALDKEESDTTILTQEILFLKGRIEETADNRDAGQPDTISNTRGVTGGFGNGGFPGGYGSIGGF